MQQQDDNEIRLPSLGDMGSSTTAKAPSPWNSNRSSSSARPWAYPRGVRAYKLSKQAYAKNEATEVLRTASERPRSALAIGVLTQESRDNLKRLWESK